MGLWAVEACALSDEELLSVLKPVMRRKGFLRKRIVEEVSAKVELYWPYDIVSFRFSLSDGSSGSGRTAINLISASLAGEPRELILSMRLSYASGELRRRPLPPQALAPEPMTRGLEVMEDIASLLEELAVPRERMRRAMMRAGRELLSPARRLLLPPIEAMHTMRQFSDAYAKIEALMRELNARLGLDADARLEALEPLGQEGPLYFPSLVVKLSGPSGDERYVVLDLSGPRPELDVELTYLSMVSPLRSFLDDFF